MKHYDPQEIHFDEPVEIQLPKYPTICRISGVRYGRNPYGVGRNKVSYAIAEWMRPEIGKWRECRELVTLMRLANRVEHPFPKNEERYANNW
jgi:hypothetical protein